MKNIFKLFWIAILLGAFAFAAEAASSGSFTFTVTLIPSVNPPAVTSIELSDTSSGSTQYTNDRTVKVTASGVANTPTHMMLSEDASFSGASWVTYANPTTFQLTPGEGTKRVYYKLKNDGGESSTVNDQIILDTISPGTPTLSTPADHTNTNDTTPTFTWTAVTDGTSGVNNYQIVISGTTVATLPSTSTSYTPVTEFANGTYSWKVRAQDNAENNGDYSSVFSLTIDTTSPEVSDVETERAPDDNVALDSTIIIDFSKAMDRDSVESAFSISPAIAGTFSWSSDSKALTFTPAEDLTEGTPYAITIATSARDVFGNGLTTEYVTRFITTWDASEPVVVIRTLGLALKDNDPIDEDTIFDVLITDNLSIDASSLHVLLNEEQVTYNTISFSPTEMQINHSATDLAVGEHAIRVEVSDDAGNTAVKEITGLRVYAGAPSVIGEVVAYPTPFRPKSGEICRIAYNLTADTNVTILIYGQVGLIWKKDFPANQNGGKAGYNVIEWDGRTSSGYIAGNAIYPLLVVIDGQSKAKAYIVVND